jgi:hypothetical protein
MNRKEKYDIMSFCLIHGTAADHRGGSGKLPLLNVTKGGFAETLRYCRKAVRPEHLVGTCHEPVRSFCPLLGLIVPISTLPQKLGVMKRSSGRVKDRKSKGHTVRHAIVGVLSSSISA